MVSGAWSTAGTKLPRPEEVGSSGIRLLPQGFRSDSEHYFSFCDHSSLQLLQMLLEMCHKVPAFVIPRTAEADRAHYLARGLAMSHTAGKPMRMCRNGLQNLHKAAFVRASVLRTNSKCRLRQLRLLCFVALWARHVRAEDQFLGVSSCRSSRQLCGFGASAREQGRLVTAVKTSSCRLRDFETICVPPIFSGTPTFRGTASSLCICVCRIKLVTMHACGDIEESDGAWSFRTWIMRWYGRQAPSV